MVKTKTIQYHEEHKERCNVAFCQNGIQDAIENVEKVTLLESDPLL